MNTSYPKFSTIPFDSETEDFMNSGFNDDEEPIDSDASDEDVTGSDSAAGDANNEKAVEFAFIMLLLLLKVSLFFIQEYAQEKGYTTTLFEIIQF